MVCVVTDVACLCAEITRAWYAVHVQVQGALPVVWGAPWTGPGDAREIYRDDRPVSFLEFVLWSARVGGIQGTGNKHPPNPHWMVKGAAVQPPAYVPTPWAGRPVMWLEEVRTGFVTNSNLITFNVPLIPSLNLTLNLNLNVTLALKINH